MGKAHADQDRRAGSTDWQHGIPYARLTDEKRFVGGRASVPRLAAYALLATLLAIAVASAVTPRAVMLALAANALALVGFLALPGSVGLAISFASVNHLMRQPHLSQAAAPVTEERRLAGRAIQAPTVSLRARARRRTPCEPPPAHRG